VTDINARLPGVDIIELGLFAGLQGGPKYEQPSPDVPLHQASRAEKLKKSYLLPAPLIILLCQGSLH